MQTFREGKVVIWGKNNEGDFIDVYMQLVKRDAQKEEADSVTSLAFAPVFFNEFNEYLIAVGTETGMIRLYLWQPDTEHTGSEWLHCYQLDNQYP